MHVNGHDGPLVPAIKKVAMVPSYGSPLVIKCQGGEEEGDGGDVNWILVGG